MFSIWLSTIVSVACLLPDRIMTLKNFDGNFAQQILIFGLGVQSLPVNRHGHGGCKLGVMIHRTDSAQEHVLCSDPVTAIYRISLTKIRSFYSTLLLLTRPCNLHDLTDYFAWLQTLSILHCNDSFSGIPFVLFDTYELLFQHLIL